MEAKKEWKVGDRIKDGLGYVGVIKKIEKEKGRYLIHYEDGSESFARHLHAAKPSGKGRQ